MSQKRVREKVIRLGVSQISGASRTSVGGYAEDEPEEEDSAQFDVSDKRTLDQVVHWLMDMGYIPSFARHAIEKEELATVLWHFVKQSKFRIAAT